MPTTGCRDEIQHLRFPIIPGFPRRKSHSTCAFAALLFNLKKHFSKLLMIIVVLLFFFHLSFGNHGTITLENVLFFDFVADNN